MHFKRRQRKALRRVLTVLLAVVLIAALGLVGWWFRDDIAGLFSGAPETAQTEEPVIALTLSPFSGTNSFTACKEEDAQKEYIDTFLTYAAAHGANAVFVDMVTGSGDTAETFGRDRAYATAANVTANDGLFHRFDPMAYLTSAAKKSGLSVYAMYTTNGTADETMNKAAKRAVRKYRLADAYFKNERTAEVNALNALTSGTGATADSTVAATAEGADVTAQAAVRNSLGTLQSLSGTRTLPYTTAATWTEPGAVFLAAIGTDFAGVVIDDYALATSFPDAFTRMMTALDTSTAVPDLLNYTASTALAVTYPAADAKIYTGTCFIMGTSDPAQPLTMNGAEVLRTGKTGLFGVLVDLSVGENTFTFAQGGTQVPFVINRLESTWSGGGIQHDGTQSVGIGSYVSVSNWIAGLLYDPSGDNKISETVRQGGIAKVVDCVETTRSGKTTWAYQLTSGDYILAYNTNFLGANVPTPSFTGATAAATATGETLTFTGSGTPMAYATRDGSNLVLHFYDTDFAADFSVTGSSMVMGTQVNDIENGKELVLNFAARLYGYSVEYENNTIVLTLKKTPVRSDAFAKPLTGVSVLLDAGHGADDTGAMGTAGSEAPVEKDVNLAVTLAAKYRLEQMGATVYTIRSDDTFLTLEQRNQKISELQPDFFIAVHHNSVELTVDANNSGGSECYYFYDAGKPLAEALVQNVVAETGRQNRGVMWGYYYVTRNTTCPAVLMEFGFMVNPSEYEDVVNEETIWAEGDAIAASIFSCVGTV